MSNFFKDLWFWKWWILGTIVVVGIAFIVIVGVEQLLTAITNPTNIGRFIKPNLRSK